jgi:hypothetical protein
MHEMNQRRAIWGWISIGQQFDSAQGKMPIIRETNEKSRLRARWQATLNWRRCESAAAFSKSAAIEVRQADWTGTASALAVVHKYMKNRWLERN